MSFRKQWEPVLEKIAKRLAKDEIDVEHQGRVSIRHYYCTSVMDVVRHLRRFTKAKDQQGQHDVLKILFKWYRYGDRGRFEVKQGICRLDIWIEDTHEAIEVKTIVDVSVAKVKGKASLVLKLKSKQRRRVDRAWIIFFKKFRGGASPRIACKYILCWVDIDVTGKTNVRELNKDLVILMHKSKATVAEKLDVDEDIIIPVDNIMLVEDLERELMEKDAALDEKENIIADQAKALAHKDKENSDQAQALADQAQALAHKDKENADQAQALAHKDKENADQAKVLADQAKTIAELKKRLA
jgi:hypothetical protein